MNRKQVTHAALYAVLTFIVGVGIVEFIRAMRQPVLPVGPTAPATSETATVSTAQVATPPAPVSNVTPSAPAATAPVTTTTILPPVPTHAAMLVTSQEHIGLVMHDDGQTVRLETTFRHGNHDNPQLRNDRPFVAAVPGYGGSYWSLARGAGPGYYLSYRELTATGSREWGTSNETNETASSMVPLNGGRRTLLAVRGAIRGQPVWLLRLYTPFSSDNEKLELPPGKEILASSQVLPLRQMTLLSEAGDEEDFVFLASTNPPALHIFIRDASSGLSQTLIPQDIVPLAMDLIRSRLVIVGKNRNAVVVKVYRPQSTGIDLIATYYFPMAPAALPDIKQIACRFTNGAVNEICYIAEGSTTLTTLELTTINTVKREILAPANTAARLLTLIDTPECQSVWCAGAVNLIEPNGQTSTELFVMGRQINANFTQRHPGQATALAASNEVLLYVLRNADGSNGRLIPVPLRNGVTANPLPLPTFVNDGQGVRDVLTFAARPTRDF